MVFELAAGGDLFQFLCGAPGQRVDEEEGRALVRQVGSWSVLAYAHPTSPRNVSNTNNVCARGPGIYMLLQFLSHVQGGSGGAR